jgi:hypothetical protein
VPKLDGARGRLETLKRRIFDTSIIMYAIKTATGTITKIVQRWLKALDEEDRITLARSGGLRGAGNALRH